MKSLRRGDTFWFYEQAERIDFDLEDKSLSIGGKKYQLLCSDWEGCEESSSMVSIGRGLDKREIVYYDGDSPYLDCVYQRFLQGITRPVESQPLFFKQIICFTRSIFLEATAESIAAVTTRCASVQVPVDGEMSKTIPAVNLEHFIQAKIGWCRHHTMLNWYLLKRAQKEGLLPRGRVIHYRITPDLGPAHALILFLREEHSHLQIIDSALHHCLQLPTDHGLCVEKYGESFYQELCNRFLPRFDDCLPTQVLAEEKTEDRDELEEFDDRMSMSRSH